MFHDASMRRARARAEPARQFADARALAGGQGGVNLGRRNGSLSPASRCIGGKSIRSSNQEAATPQPDCLTRDFESVGDRSIGHPLTGEQHDSAADHEPIRGRPAAHPAFEHRPLLRGDGHADRRPFVAAHMD